MSETEYAERLLTATESLFLKKLIFWIRHPKHYGIYEDGRVWIYNRLEDWAKQLNVSKTTVRRVIKRLCEMKIIEKKYLNPNRRNRTLYYSADFSYLKTILKSRTGIYSCGCKGHINEQKEGHMGGHMYKEAVNSKHKDKSYKSNKSGDSCDSVSGNFEIRESSNEKPSVVQEMVRIWKEEFPSNPVTLTRKLSAYLVKIFKDKFNSSLSEWKKYLKLIKTSAWLTGKDFGLSLFWAIKFTTAERVSNGEFGVRRDGIPEDESEVTEKAGKHVDSANETESCKEMRRKIIGKYGAAVYNSWFAKIALREENGTIKAEYPNYFVEDYVKNNFSGVFESESKNEKTFAKSIRAKDTCQSLLLLCSKIKNSNFEGISAVINETKNKTDSVGCGFYGNRNNFCKGG